MIENGNLKEHGILGEMRKAESDMKAWCQMLRRLGDGATLRAADREVVDDVVRAPGDDADAARADNLRDISQ